MRHILFVFSILLHDLVRAEMEECNTNHQLGDLAPAEATAMGMRAGRGWERAAFAGGSWVETRPRPPRLSRHLSLLQRGRAK